MDILTRARQLAQVHKEAGTAVSSVAPHGPGGMASTPGLGGAANASLGINGRKRQRRRMCKVCQQREAKQDGMCTKCSGLLLKARAKAYVRTLPKPAVSQEKFSKASTQFDMPPNIRAQALLFASTIDKADLAEDGIETDTHVTIKYGVRPDMLPVISRIAQETPPMVLRFGGVSLFTSNDDFDVVKVEVDSNDLRSLNGRLSALPGSDNTRPFYNPHLTIAYVRKGAGEKYTGVGPLSGQTVTVNQLTFSDENGNKTTLPLAGSGWAKRGKGEDIVGVIRETMDRLDAIKSEIPPETISWVVGEPLPGFSVFKDSSGDYRWVSISSNSYRDRDQEIVSQAALEADVEYADKTKEYGPLRFWHEPGWDIGDCDFNMMHGRMLIESGTFKTPAIGAAVAQAQKEYQLSIGFNHPRNEPSDGIYYHIRRFERSLVPSGRAANPFTSLSVTKENDMSTQAEKVAQLKQLLADDNLVASVLDGATAAQKTAEDLGVAFKEQKVDLAQLAQSDPAALLNYALENFETAQKAEKEGSTADEAEDDEEMNMKTFMTKMSGTMDRMEKCMSRMDGYMQKMSGSAKKEADGDQGEDATPDPVTADAQAATKAAQALTNSRVETLESTVKELTGTLNTALAQLKEAREKEAAQPRAFQNGNRPTEDSSNVNPNRTAVKEADPNNVTGDEQTEKSFDQNVNGFMEFLTMPPGGQQ